MATALSWEGGAGQEGGLRGRSRLVSSPLKIVHCITFSAHRSNFVPLGHVVVALGGAPGPARLAGEDDVRT